MATQLQLRRGTTVENDGFTGALAEVTVDTDTHELRVHDGSTQGGFVIPTESDMNAALGDKADASDVYDKATVDTALNAKAETDLGNITDGAKNVASWSSNVTNCITEIPQDIKLELNAGALTLKAGSKIYVPNGFEQDGTTPHFDTVVIENDMNTAYSNVGVLMLFWSSSFNYIFGYDITYCNSGSSVPSNFTGWFYNTTTNTINQYQSGTIIQNRTVSFPLGIITTDSSSIKSIDQVFNGFGYIGSTVFALPGVKGLIPNGRNADGTLNNTVTNDYNTVKTVQVNTSTAKIAMYVGGGLGSQTNGFELNEQENFNYDSGVLTNALEVARVIVDSNSRITAFSSKTAFHSVDYSDTEYIAHQAMPSDRYVNLTLGTSGNTYTMPADGYLCLEKVSTAQNQMIRFICGDNIRMICISNYQNNYLSLTMPVKKGTVVSVSYTAAGDTNKFTFTYANGAK